MNTSRKDRNSITDIMTKKDIIYSQTYYYRQGCHIIKPLDPSLPVRLIEIEFEKQPSLHQNS